MSYDLTTWKRSATAAGDETADVLAATAGDTAHPAMQRFDARAFVRDLQAAFGREGPWSDHDDDVDPPFHFEVADFTGTAANWVGVSIGFGKVATVVPKLVRVATGHGLVVYDFQTGELHAGR